MRSLYLLGFLLLFSLQTMAQQNHFIYIQTENKQPFYVKIADRLLSSSSVGYLVIPKLQDGKYEMGIGFPKDEWPLQKVTVVIKNNDAGYVLKNFESKGWGLFNMQTLDIIMASGNSNTSNTAKDTKTDGFADVLADVVNTPSIKQKPVVKQEEVAVVKPAAVENNKTSTEIRDDKPVVSVKEKEALKAAVKLFSTIDTSGRSIVYVDSYENRSDTIRVFIPYKKEVVAEKEVAEKKVEPVAEPIKKDEPKQEPKNETKQDNKQDAKFIDMEIPNPNSKADTEKTDKKVNTPGEIPADKKEVAGTNRTVAEPETESKMVIMTNSDCKTNASAEDFLKLRKKMAAETSDDDMIAVARKAFKAKCFSTEQIGNLSSLFLKDDGRYNFFDAAYPRVSDSQNFAGLVTKLSDEYYITRFKAMIRH